MTTDISRIDAWQHKMMVHEAIIRVLHAVKQKEDRDEYNGTSSTQEATKMDQPKDC